MPNLPRFSALALLLATASACSAPPTQPEAAMPSSDATPVGGFVTDLPAFEQFIASQPTPAQFKARYPDVVLVLPGQIATKEFRLNHSRYFAQLDADGRISGGKFQ